MQPAIAGGAGLHERGLHHQVQDDEGRGRQKTGGFQPVQVPTVQSSVPGSTGTVRYLQSSVAASTGTVQFSVSASTGTIH